MKKQTAVELLKETIDTEVKLGTKMVINWDFYLAMEREQIVDAFVDGIDSQNLMDAENYYNKKYGGEQ